MATAVKYPDDVDRVAADVADGLKESLVSGRSVAHVHWALSSQGAAVAIVSPKTSTLVSFRMPIGTIPDSLLIVDAIDEPFGPVEC